MTIKIGTAGWSVPRQVADPFPSDGSSLERYAARFPIAEINSSFHRPHRSSTWERWRDSVPDDFRFSVKLPKAITHVGKLVSCAEELAAFLQQVHLLGDKLAVLLVQLPPKLEFDRGLVREFFGRLGTRSSAAVACEPRNASWFAADADAALARLRVARVAADPPICEAAAVPGGWRGLSYWRLHGSPIVYRSSYQDRIAEIADRLKNWSSSGDEWCIFDNTAASAATGDALALVEKLGAAAARPDPPQASGEGR